MRILVTGGVRSGKSKHAEALLAGVADVTYIVPNCLADRSDPDWGYRAVLHRARRQPTWLTAETS